jgi:hypothetical protein
VVVEEGSVSLVVVRGLWIDERFDLERAKNVGESQVGKDRFVSCRSARGRQLRGALHCSAGDKIGDRS